MRRASWGAVGVVVVPLGSGVVVAVGVGPPALGGGVLTTVVVLSKVVGVPAVMVRSLRMAGAVNAGTWFHEVLPCAAG